MVKRILILAANPLNTPRVRLDQEIREIQHGLERARKRDEFVLKQEWAVRAIDIRRAMLDFKPSIVHFCGHGSGEEGIVIEDESGKAKLVDAEVLSSFFELFADTVEAVVLNACYSEIQAKAIAQYIHYVVGMQKAIGDAAAIEFAVAFYDAVAAGKSLHFAYKLACNAIRWKGLPDNLAPILHSFSDKKLVKDKLEDENNEINNSFGKNTTISILFVVSYPNETPRLRLENEIKVLKEKLQISVYQNRFLLHQQEFLRPEDLSFSLNYIKPNIIHFVGGAKSELGFVDKSGRSHPIPSYALGSIFKEFSNQVKCVVLENCYSESQAEAISQYVEYVVGMGRAIDNKATMEFTFAFYQALGEGCTIEEAYDLGQIHLQDFFQSPIVFPSVLLKRKNI